MCIVGKDSRPLFSRVGTSAEVVREEESASTINPLGDSLSGMAHTSR
jgi:hypothetical protein